MKAFNLIIYIIYLLVMMTLSVSYAYAYTESCEDNIVVNSIRNYVLNPDFENYPAFSGWIVNPNPQGVNTAIDNYYSTSGTASAKITWDGSTTSQNYWHTHQVINVMPSRTYRVYGYVKTEGIDCECCNPNPGPDCLNSISPEVNGIKLLVTDPDIAYNATGYWSAVTQGVYGSEDWALVSTDFTVPAYTSRVNIAVRRIVGAQTGESYGTAWIDDIQLLPVPLIYDLTVEGDSIVISGESFGSDPGVGNKSDDENCVLYEDLCLADNQVLTWSDSTIEIENIGSGAIKVRSGGVVSNIIQDQPDISLVNSKLSIGIAGVEEGSGIASVTDLATGMQFVDNTSDIQPLYKLVVKEDPFDESSKSYITSKEASFITRQYMEEGTSKVVTITTGHCNEFVVTARIELTQDAGAQFAINIENFGSRVIQSVRYPLIAAKTILGNSSLDDTIVVPVFEGYLLKDPAGQLGLPSIKDTKFRDIEYPGPMTLQMMAYYDTQAGLYMAMDDNAGHKKRFGFERIRDNYQDYILFSFLHITSEGSPLDQSYGGNNLLVNYRVNVDSFHGDWYVAADRYKDWAVGQPWASTKLDERLDIPDWIYDFTAMIGCFNCMREDFVDIVNYYSGILDVQNLLFYPGGFWGLNNGYQVDTDEDGVADDVRIAWSGIDYFSDEPVYDPAEAEVPPFTLLSGVISDLKAQGSDVLLFLEGMHWDHYFYKLDSGEACEIHGENYYISPTKAFFDDRQDYYDLDGKGSQRDSHTLLNEDMSKEYRDDFAYPGQEEDYCRITSKMCIGSDDNNIVDLVLYNNIKRGIDHGTRLMSLDGIASGKIEGCWNDDHGHPIGEGIWTHLRYKSVLNDIKNIVSDKGMAGDFALGMENQHELYLQDLQFQWVRHDQLLMDWMAGNKKINLFNYIYKEYYMGIERGAYLANGNNLHYRWQLAIDFIQGTLQGTYLGLDGVTKKYTDYVPDVDLVEFYKRIIRMKDKGFYKAGMLHPPQFSGLPDEIIISLKQNGITYDYFTEPVQSSVLKVDENRVSYLFANFNNDDESGCSGDKCDIFFYPPQYDLPAGNVNVTVTKEGLNGRETELFEDVSLAYGVGFSIDGGEVVEVRIEYGDIDKDGLNNNAELQIGTDPLVADTDGDGLNDGDEVAISTDPLNQDTDKDKVPDGNEVDLNSDPLNILSPENEGWNLSKDSDFYSSDTTFKSDETMNILVWSEWIDTNNLKRSQFRIKEGKVTVLKGDLLVGEQWSTYEASVDMSGLSTGSKKLVLILRDKSGNVFKENITFYVE